jgi:hypothetical protein
MVDMDALRWLYPAVEGDRFSSGLGFRNLAAIWPHLIEAGARSVILADVVEDPAQVAAFEALMPGSKVTVVRLDVPMDLIHERLAGRESGESLEWHLNRAPELQGIMERAGVGRLRWPRSSPGGSAWCEAGMRSHAGHGWVGRRRAPPCQGEHEVLP